MDATRPTASKVAGNSKHGQQVFSITELFEEIMCSLDMRTLLLAQRVDTHWRMMISTSRLLQQKLFLLPATKAQLANLNAIELCQTITVPNDYDWYNDCDGDEEEEEEPVITPQYCYNLYKPINPNGRGWLSAPKYRQLVTYNPLLFARKNDSHPMLRSDLIRVSDSTTTRLSWEKMLPLQPPQTKVTFYLAAHTSSCGFYPHRQFNIAGNIPLLDLVDVAQEELKKIDRPCCLRTVAAPDGRNAVMHLLGSQVPDDEMDALGFEYYYA